MSDDKITAFDMKQAADKVDAQLEEEARAQQQADHDRQVEEHKKLLDETIIVGGRIVQVMERAVAHLDTDDLPIDRQLRNVKKAKSQFQKILDGLNGSDNTDEVTRLNAEINNLRQQLSAANQKWALSDNEQEVVKMMRGKNPRVSLGPICEGGEPVVSDPLYPKELAKVRKAQEAARAEQAAKQSSQGKSGKSKGSRQFVDANQASQKPPADVEPASDEAKPPQQDASQAPAPQPPAPQSEASTTTSSPPSADEPVPAEDGKEPSPSEAVPPRHTGMLGRAKEAAKEAVKKAAEAAREQR